MIRCISRLITRGTAAIKDFWKSKVLVNIITSTIKTDPMKAKILQMLYIVALYTHKISMVKVKSVIRLFLAGPSFKEVETPQLSSNIDNFPFLKGSLGFRKTWLNSVYSFWLTGDSFLHKLRLKRDTRT